MRAGLLAGFLPALLLVQTLIVSACGTSADELAEVVRVADPNLAGQLLRGFHPIEDGSWRWTESRFAVALRPPRKADRRGAWLVLHYSVPKSLIERHQQIRITPSIDSSVLPTETCTRSGVSELRREVSSDLLAGKSVTTAEFTVEPFLAPSPADRRELGVIVHTVGLLLKK